MGEFGSTVACLIDTGSQLDCISASVGEKFAPFLRNHAQPIEVRTGAKIIQLTQFLILHPFNIITGKQIGPIYCSIMPFLNHEILLSIGTSRVLGIIDISPKPVVLPKFHKPAESEAYDEMNKLNLALFDCMLSVVPRLHDYSNLHFMEINVIKCDDLTMLPIFYNNNLGDCLFLQNKIPNISNEQLFKLRAQQTMQIGADLTGKPLLLAKWHKLWKSVVNDVASGDSYDYGCWKNNEVKFEWKDTFVNGGNPVSLKPITQTPEITTLLKQKCDILCNRGYFTKTVEDEWRLHLFAIKKKDKNEIRLIADMRPLNTRLKNKRAFCLSIDSILTKLITFKYFFTFDITGAYWQMPVAPEFRKFCVVGTPFGNFQYNRLPQGLVIAVYHMHAGMHDLLGDIKNVFTFFDDISGGADTLEDCIDLAFIVLQRLQSVGIRLNAKKCFIGVTSVKVLGYTVHPGKLTREPTYLLKIRECPQPRTYKQLKAFLGLCQWISDSIPGLAHHLAPLSEILKRESKKSPFLMTPTEINIFEHAREVCCKPLDLELPDLNQPFKVFTDASDLAYAGVVTQLRENNSLKIVGVFSKKFTNNEQRWHVSHKEAFAIAATLWRFKDILLNAPIEIFSDHKNLVNIYASAALDKRAKDRLARWFSTLGPFDITFRYFPGRLNHCADFLSRKFTPIQTDQVPLRSVHFNTWFAHTRQLLIQCNFIRRCLFNHQELTSTQLSEILQPIQCDTAITLPILQQMYPFYEIFITDPSTISLEIESYNTELLKKSSYKARKVKRAKKAQDSATFEESKKEFLKYAELSDNKIRHHISAPTRRSARLANKKKKTDWVKFENFGYNTPEQLKSILSEHELTQAQCDKVTQAVQNALNFLSHPATHTQFGDPKVMLHFQKNDDHCCRLFDILNYPITHSKYISAKTSLPQSIFKLHSQCQISDQLVTFKERPWVPQKLRHSILHHFHKSPAALHIGAEKMYLKIKQHFFWPKCEEDIRNFIQWCKECQLRNKGPGHPKTTMISWQQAQPFASIFIDFVGPLCETHQGNKYVLTLGDRLSGYMIMVPTPNQLASTTALAIYNQWVCYFGIPFELISDHGSNFMSDTMQTLCDLLNIHKIAISVRHPQSNWIERMHQVFKNMLIAMCEMAKENAYECKNWDLCIPQIQLTMNSTPKHPQRISPLHYLLGHTPNEPNAIKLNTFLKQELTPDNALTIFQTNQRIARNIANSYTKLKREKYIDYQNKNRKPTKFLPGMHVWYDISGSRTGNEKKLHPHNFDGPYTIHKIISPHALCKLKDGSKKWLHLDHLKRAYVKPEECLILSTDKIQVSIETLQPLLALSQLSLYKTRVNPKFASQPVTPIPLAQLLCFLNQETTGPCLDLCAGTGVLTQFYPTPLIAIDNNLTSIKAGKSLVPWAIWKNLDLTQEASISYLLQTYSQYFITIISNPPFPLALFLLELASRLIHPQIGQIYFILPADFFGSSHKRLELWKQIHLKIDHVYITHRWNYYSHIPKSNTKITIDSIFKFSYEPNPSTKTDSFRATQIHPHHYQEAAEYANTTLKINTLIPDYQEQEDTS